MKIKNWLIIINCLSALFFSCTVNGKNLKIPANEINQEPSKNKQQYNIYEYMEIIKSDYIVKNHADENYNIYYYSNNKIWEEIISGDIISHARSASDPLLIYYKILNNEKINSIIILAKNSGGLNNNFYFLIEDIRGNILYKSGNYPFTDFSDQMFSAKEYEVNLSDNSDEIVIKLFTNYHGGQNWLGIGQSYSDKSYSVIYADEDHYLRTRNFNWSVFVKTVK